MSTPMIDAVRFTDHPAGEILVSQRRSVGAKVSALAGQRVDLLTMQRTLTSIVYLDSNTKN